MKKIIFLTTTVLIIIGFRSFSQEIVFDENYLADTIEVKNGQNMKKYSHTFISIGANIYNQEIGIETNPILSRNFNVGYRFKRKISNFYALGYNIFYSYYSYNLKQDSSKIFPNNIIHDNERYSSSNLSFELYNRFNFGKRGNIIGRYIDIGTYGNFAFSNKHITIDKFDIANENNSSTKKTINKGLIYVNKLNYGITARIGINKFVVFAMYRISDLFKDKIDGYELIYPELPRLTCGFEVGIF